MAQPLLDRFRMDGHKLHWHPERVAQWLRGEPIAPLYIDMGITRTCNVACRFCYYAVPENRRPEIIPTDRLIRFFRDAAAAGVRAIGILGDGEPTLHPDLYGAVEAGAAAGLDLAVATNGVALREPELPRLLRSLQWLRFTLSSATGASYALMMGRNARTFERVIDRIRASVAVKRELGLSVTIGVQMVMIDLCADQVVPLAALSRELGVDYFVVKQASERPASDSRFTPADYGRFEAIFREAEALSGDGFGVIVKRLKMAKRERSYDTCYGCAFLPQINGAGDFYCCGNFFDDPAFRIGNIIDSDFRALLASDRYREVLARVEREVDVHRQCGVACRQNEINEYLAMLKTPPQHLNFI